MRKLVFMAVLYFCLIPLGMAATHPLNHGIFLHGYMYGTAFKLGGTTWYVRDGGGTSAQCTGTTNAKYSGSGSSQPCAFSNINYLFGWDDCAAGGTGGCSQGSLLVAGGDTVYINGDSDVNLGQQAVYKIGYGSPQMTGCTSGDTHGCMVGGVPGGSSGSPTIISGLPGETHNPQLLGVNLPYQVLYAVESYTTIQNIEITANTSCAYNDPVNGCTYSDGLDLGNASITLTNVYIHGNSRYGINIGTSSFGPATFTNVWVIGNGYGGVTIGSDTATSVSGTLTWYQPIIEWNGCQEAYPVTGGVDNPANYTNCFGQQGSISCPNCGGYGDGLAFGPSGNLNAGNWIVEGPGSISFNTQDGLDTLHGDGNGTILVDKMRFEGNAGQQIKANGTNFYLTNSVVIGDCGWWYNSSHTTTGAMQPGDSCRAQGDTILFNVTNNSVTEIYNNTILSNGSVALESTDGETTGCNQSGSSGTQIHIYNNILYGGYWWLDDTTFNSTGGNSQPTYIYNDGSNGDGLGTCGNITWDENYNIVDNFKNSNQNCVGSHDKCGTNPGFVNTIPMGTSGGAANTYYQGQQALTYMPIKSSSAAITAGSTGLAYWNTENDYHNVTRASPPTMGALELNSCAASLYACFYSSDCCNDSCVNNLCASSGGGSSGFMCNFSGTSKLSGTWVL